MEDILTTAETAISQDITITGALAIMGVSLAIGLIIAITYIFTHKDGYQQSFAITLTMLPVILAMIIVFVGSNIARAFSLAGTLSIIRFRSAPGDPEDIGYIFFTIAAGLACGVGLWQYGIIFVVVMCLFMIVIKSINFGSSAERIKTLKITIPEDLDYEHVFDDVLKKYTSTYSLARVKTTDLGSLYEIIYRIDMHKDCDEKEFIDELRCRNGNLNIVLSLAADKNWA